MFKFEIGKKYMVSKRKYMKRMNKHNKNEVHGWVNDFVGVPFIVTEDMIDKNSLISSINITPKGHSGFYGLIIDWCIEIV